jgi:hypothetical protein
VCLLQVIRVVGEAAERHGVSIYAILQTPFTDPENIDFVITTEPAKFSQVRVCVCARAVMHAYASDALKGAGLWVAFALDSSRRGDVVSQVNALASDLAKEDFSKAPPVFFGCL